MITQEKFNELCQAFSLKFLNVKKNIPSINKLSTALNRPIEKEIGKSKDTDCKSGCSHCCYLRVDAIPHEIISIYFYLNKNLDKEQLKATRQKVNDQFLKIKDLSIDEHFTTNIQCPLLVDNHCSAYEARPLACAGYHSISVEQCIKSYNNPNEVNANNEHGIPMIASVEQEQSVQNTVAANVIEAAGDDKTRYELINGLHHLFENPNSIQKWKNGHKFIK